jgi:arginine deiminase
VELAHDTTLAIWGRPREVVLHRPLFEVMPEAATPEIVALFERVYTTGTAHTAHEQLTYIHRHGRQEEVYWNVVFEPQRGPDGRVMGLFTVGTEVTEQVRARQQLQQFNQELDLSAPLNATRRPAPAPPPFVRSQPDAGQRAAGVAPAGKWRP